MLTGGQGFFWQRYNAEDAVHERRRASSPARRCAWPACEVGTVTDVELRRRAGRRDLRGQQGDARPDHDRVGRDARVGLAARREPRSTSRRRSRGTPIPEWGYVPAGHAAGAIRGHRRLRPARASTKLTALRRGHPRAARGTVGKLMTDEQLYMELTSVRRDRRRDDARHPGGTRDARQADERSEGRQRARGVAQERRGDDRGSSTPDEGSLGKLMNDDAFSRAADGDDGQSDDLTR